MTYGHRCPDHGEFEDRRPMEQAANAAACPTCGMPSPRYYGRHPVNLILPNRFTDKHNTHFDYLPKLSDYDSREDYLRDTKDLQPYTGEARQKPKMDATPIARDVLEQPVIRDYIAAEKAKALNV